MRSSINNIASIILLILLTTSLTQAQSGLKNISEIKDQCNMITADFAAHNFDSAFDRVIKLWVFNRAEMEQLAKQTKEQLSKISDRYGDVIDWQFAGSKEVPGILYKLSYVVRHEWHGLRLEFRFYKGKDNIWYLNNFSWDDSLSELLKD